MERNDIEVLAAIYERTMPGVLDAPEWRVPDEQAKRRMHMHEVTIICGMTETSPHLHRLEERQTTSTLAAQPQQP